MSNTTANNKIDDEIHRLHCLLENAVDALGEAGQLSQSLDLQHKGTVLKNISKAIGAVYYSTTLIPADPLAADQLEDRVPDPPMTDEEWARCDRLTEWQIHAIDRAILSGSSSKWQKVTMVVAKAIYATDLAGIPDLYYAERVSKLVGEGLLEHQGELNNMRLCEVRRPNPTGR